MHVHRIALHFLRHAVEAVAQLLGGLTKPIIKTCTKVLSNLPSGSKITLPTGVDPEQVKKLLQGLLTDGGGLGGLGGIITGGS